MSTSNQGSKSAVLAARTMPASRLPAALGPEFPSSAAGCRNARLSSVAPRWARSLLHEVAVPLSAFCV